MPVGGAGLLALAESFVAAVDGAAGGPAASLVDAYSGAAKAMAEHALAAARTRLVASLDVPAASPLPLMDAAVEAAVGDAARGARRLLLRHLGFAADAVAQVSICLSICPSVY